MARDMAVITADGIVGKVRDVFPHTAQVLAINDQSSGAGVILENTRIRGILRGNAAGQPQIVDILADKRIQKGENVITAGGDQIFPRGLPVGLVEKVDPDPERDGFINIVITPAAHLDRLDEVLVITSTEPRFSPEQQQDLADSQTLKGDEAAILKQEEEQRKASAVMAERLPGLIDPKLPPDQQPLLDNSNPNPVAHPPLALHPDRFTPGGAANPAAAATASESGSSGKSGAGSVSGSASGTQPKKTSAGADGAPATPAKPKPKQAASEKAQPDQAQPAEPAQTPPPPQGETHQNELRRN
jgi:rod shape-determining protein MreC